MRLGLQYSPVPSLPDVSLWRVPTARLDRQRMTRKKVMIEIFG